MPLNLKEVIKTIHSQHKKSPSELHLTDFFIGIKYFIF